MLSTLLHIASELVFFYGNQQTLALPGDGAEQLSHRLCTTSTEEEAGWA